MPLTLYWEEAIPASGRALVALQSESTFPGSAMRSPQYASLAAGMYLNGPDGQALAQVEAPTWLPQSQGASCPAVWIRSLRELPPEQSPIHVDAVRQGISLAWVTMSDKGARQEREDTSGPSIASILGQTLSLSYIQGFVLPDDRDILRGVLHRLSFIDRFDLICTTGGTGVAPRDITPEATLAVLDKRLPGFEQVMTASSLAKTPHGMISRAVAGVAGQTLICNLPGSPKGVRENLESILPALQHTLDKIHGDPADCARIN